MKRPFGVTIIAVLLLIQGVVLAAVAAIVLILKASPGAAYARLPLVFTIGGLTVTDWLAAVLAGALGIFIVVSAIAVLRLRPWAWFVAMVVQGWTLATLLFNYFTHGQTSYSTLILGVVIVFYLNSRSVRRTFDLARTREAGALTEPPATTAALPAADAGTSVEGQTVLTEITNPIGGEHRRRSSDDG